MMGEELLTMGAGIANIFFQFVLTVMPLNLPFRQPFQKKPIYLAWPGGGRRPWKSSRAHRAQRPSQWPTAGPFAGRAT